MQSTLIDVLQTAWPWLLAATLLGLLLGWLPTFLLAQRRARAAETAMREVSQELAITQRLHSEEKRLREENESRLKSEFAQLSQTVLDKNSEQFLRLAQEKLQQFNVQAKASLGEKEQAIEALVKPIKEALGKTEAQLQSIEKERKEAYGSLNKHLESMASVQQSLHQETRNLVQALRRPEVRGRWGEMTLRRLVELAGMVEHCDFEEQTSSSGDSGVLRPDMIIRMPNQREIVIDAKTPLDAYLTAIEATTDAERTTALERHAAKVKERVHELAKKQYWDQFTRSPDFVVLFVPGEQFLAAALDVNPNLMEDALAKRIVLATPTSLVALLRAVAFGWRQETLAEHAGKVQELGEQLYKRMSTFLDHIGSVGKSLGSAVNHYNKAVGSLDRQVMPSLRRFPELGIPTRQEIDSPAEIETTPRPSASLEDDTESDA